MSKRNGYRHTLSDAFLWDGYAAKIPADTDARWDVSHAAIVAVALARLSQVDAHGLSFMAQTEMAEALGMSRSVILRADTALKDLGLMVATGRKRSRAVEYLMLPDRVAAEDLTDLGEDLCAEDLTLWTTSRSASRSASRLASPVTHYMDGDEKTKGSPRGRSEPMTLGQVLRTSNRPARAPRLRPADAATRHASVEAARARLDAEAAAPPQPVTEVSETTDSLTSMTVEAPPQPTQTAALIDVTPVSDPEAEARDAARLDPFAGGAIGAALALGPARRRATG